MVETSSANVREKPWEVREIPVSLREKCVKNCQFRFFAPELFSLSTMYLFPHVEK